MEKEGTYVWVALGVPTLDNVQDSPPLLNVLIRLLVLEFVDSGVFFDAVEQMPLFWLVNDRLELVE